MHISENLNLVIPIYNGEQVAGYVHSMPLSRLAFEANFRLLSSTFTEVITQGFGDIAGPRVAHLIMKEYAGKHNIDPMPLFNEMRRLTTFIRPGANGWENIAFHQAAQSKLVDEDDYAEVMNSLCFFTSVSALAPKHQLKETLAISARLWGAVLTSLSPTDWATSLGTSTTPETTPSQAVQPNSLALQRMTPAQVAAHANAPTYPPLPPGVQARVVRPPS